MQKKYNFSAALLKLINILILIRIHHLVSRLTKRSVRWSGTSDSLYSPTTRTSLCTSSRMHFLSSGVMWNEIPRTEQVHNTTSNATAPRLIVTALNERTQRVQSSNDVARSRRGLTCCASFGVKHGKRQSKVGSAMVSVVWYEIEELWIEDNLHFSLSLSGFWHTKGLSWVWCVHPRHFLPLFLWLFNTNMDHAESEIILKWIELSVCSGGYSTGFRNGGRGFYY